MGAIEGDAGESGAHFEAGETGGAGGVLTGGEDQGAEAAAGPLGMDEEGADFGGVAGGIEERIFALGELIAAVESFAFAPSAAGDDGGRRPGRRGGRL